MNLFCTFLIISCFMAKALSCVFIFFFKDDFSSAMKAAAFLAAIKRGARFIFHANPGKRSPFAIIQVTTSKISRWHFVTDHQLADDQGRISHNTNGKTMPLKSKYFFIIFNNLNTKRRIYRMSSYFFVKMALVFSLSSKLLETFRLISP